MICKISVWYQRIENTHSTRHSEELFVSNNSRIALMYSRNTELEICPAGYQPVLCAAYSVQWGDYWLSPAKQGVFWHAPLHNLEEHLKFVHRFRKWNCAGILKENSVEERAELGESLAILKSACKNSSYVKKPSSYISFFFCKLLTHIASIL